MGSIHPTVSEICLPQSLDPICAKFDKFLAHGQAHMGQMGKWPWQCTTTGLDNSTELRMEKIHQEVTEIWVPQVWQPPARPPARPPGPWRQYPSSPEGWGVKTIDGSIDIIKVYVMKACQTYKPTIIWNKVSNSRPAYRKRWVNQWHPKPQG